MKKYLPIMVLAAALTVPMTASAEITVTPTGVTVASADWIDGTDLLRVEQDTGYAIADINGNLLTDPIYYRSFTSDYGYIFAFLNSGDSNTGGLLDGEAHELIPFQYGDIKIESSKWAIGFKLTQSDANHYDYQSWSSSDSYYLIETADVYYIADGTATCVASLPREQFLDVETYGDYICIEDRSNSIKMYDSSFAVAAEGLSSVYDTGDLDLSEFDTFRENGQYGLMDKEGNVILEPSFAYIYDFRGDYAEVSTGDYEGLIDRYGNVVVPAEYDNIKTSYYGPASDQFSNYYSGGYFAVEKDRKLGFVKAGGEITCEPKISAEVMDINGASATYTDLSGELHILAADGVDTLLDSSLQNVYPLSYGSGLLYRYTDENYNYGVIDWHGQEILPCEYYDVEISGSGNYMTVSTDWNATDIYTVNYGDIAITAAPAEAPADAAAETEAAPVDAAQTEAAPIDAAQTEAAPVDAAQTEAAPVDAAQTEAAPVDAAQTEAAPAAAAGDVSLSAAADLIKSAAALVSVDAAANSETIASLLNSAAVLVESAKPEAAAMIRSAVTLITSGVTDQATLSTLLDSAAGMLG